jgi:hypothetical protein
MIGDRRPAPSRNRNPDPRCAARDPHQRDSMERRERQIQ